MISYIIKIRPNKIWQFWRYKTFTGKNPRFNANENFIKIKFNQEIILQKDETIYIEYTIKQ